MDICRGLWAPSLKAGDYFTKEISMGLKDLLGPYTTMVDDFDIPISSLDGSSKLQINKETLELKYTTEQTDYLQNSPFIRDFSQHMKPSLKQIKF